MNKTTRCTRAQLLGRLKKAEQFLNAAEILLGTANDAAASEAINAGIAAADVICCHQLGQRSASSNHNDAVILLNQVKKYREPASKDLKQLLAKINVFKRKRTLIPMLR